MELSNYLSRKIRVDLVNGYFYEGIVLNVSEDSIELRDKLDHLVTLSIKSILFIREVRND